MSWITHSHERRARNSALAQAYKTAVAIAAVVITTACGGNAALNPVAPSPSPSPSPAPGEPQTTITVTAASQAAGTFQLTAVARFADNTTRDVTSAAQWESSNTLLATVATGGKVTVLGAGEVELRAIYQNMSGSLRLVVMPGTQARVSLSGLVREVPPTQKALSGVRIEILEGPDAGKVATSDARGAYQFSGLAQGPISLEASVPGYQKWHVDRLSLDSDTRHDAWLVLVPPTNDTGATATARCNNGGWSWSKDRSMACAADGGIAYFVCPGPFCRDLTAGSK